MTVKTKEQAENAIRMGADYVGMGAVFHTSTKLDAKDMSKETLIELTGDDEGYSSSCHRRHQLR